MEKLEMKTCKKLMVTKDVCDYLSIKMSRLRTMVFKNEIPVIRLNRLLRFDPDEIEKWIENKKANK